MMTEDKAQSMAVMLLNNAQCHTADIAQEWVELKGFTHAPDLSNPIEKPDLRKPQLLTRKTQRIPCRC